MTADPQTPPGPAQRPRTHPEINEYRRTSFVEGALRSLAERGVSGTTVSTICAAAGSSRGLLGHYYKGKDEVMVAALRHLFGKMTGSVGAALDRAGTSPLARLRALPAALFSRQTFTEVNRTAFLALWHETRFNTPVRQANRQLYRKYVARTEHLFADAAAELGLSIDARRAALGFVALSDGLWLDMSIHDDLIDPAQAIELCQRHIERELEG